MVSDFVPMHNHPRLQTFLRAHTTSMFDTPEFDKIDGMVNWQNEVPYKVMRFGRLLQPLDVDNDVHAFYLPKKQR